MSLSWLPNCHVGDPFLGEGVSAIKWEILQSAWDEKCRNQRRNACTQGIYKIWGSSLADTRYLSTSLSTCQCLRELFSSVIWMKPADLLRENPKCFMLSVHTVRLPSLPAPRIYFFIILFFHFLQKFAFFFLPFVELKLFWRDEFQIISPIILGKKNQSNKHKKGPKNLSDSFTKIDSTKILHDDFGVNHGKPEQ